MRAFQRASGLEADGRFGPNTRVAMHKALCSLPPISRPQMPEPVSRLPHWFRRFLVLVAR
ncbi:MULTISPECIES: peptidoglycan-binding domain-containing protein [Leisingera]|uniref:peptidoglycan-binding domain-containing protein n=1 Tax=Leisingera TaxID=191028 RepID=UPI0039C8CD32